ncbi:MAG: hypothetical protein ACTSP9_01920 [Promethearchaeota archaeon]
MHADRGLTAVYRNIIRKDDYKLELLKKNVKDVMESQAKKYSNSNSIVNIEYIVDPIITIFNDNQENNILAIVMGYNYFYESEDHYPQQFEEEVLNSLGFLIDYEYKGVLYCFGICQDVPYVGRQKSKELYGGTLLTNYVGIIPPDACFDLYAWNVVSERRWVDKSIIYSIFPEEKITLPKSKMSLDLKEKIKRISNISNNNENVKYLFDLFVGDESEDPDIRMGDVYCDKIWLEGEKIFFRGLKVRKEAMRFLEKEKGMGENVYSLDFSNKRYGVRPGIQIDLTYRYSGWTGSDMFDFLNEK